MDKVLLRRDDVLELFAWLKDNKDLVRSMPMPLKAVEIAFVYNDIRIKGIRQERWIREYKKGEGKKKSKTYKIGQEA